MIDLPKVKTKYYGWKPDLPDQRDKKYKLVSPSKVKLVSTKNLQTYRIPPRFDQGQLGSCTANAINWMLHYLAINKHCQSPIPESLLPFSRLFVYYNERLMEGSVNSDAGAAIRDGIKSISKAGVCSEITWPYDISHFTQQPPAGAYNQALQFKSLDYSTFDPSQGSASAFKASLVDCLSKGFPFVNGISVYTSFESDSVAKTGKVPLPKRIETLEGGHAICCIDYDSKTDRFIYVNSWGEEWGLNVPNIGRGFFSLPASYVINQNLSSDFWTIRLIL